MKYSMSTPHQFHPQVPYVDTLLVSSESPISLDVAVPHLAARFIMESLCRKLSDRYQGRTAVYQAGPMFQYLPLSPEALSVCKAWNPTLPIRYGVLLVDRLCIKPCSIMYANDGTTWLVFDWWQWLRSNVPRHRMADAFMYLCCTSPVYRSSPEFSRLQLPPTVTEAMASEGEKLLTAVADEVSRQMVELWKTHSVIW